MIPNTPPAQGIPVPSAPSQVIQSGLMRAAPLAVVIAEEQAKAEKAEAAPVIQGIAGHIRTCWAQARTARMNTIEQRMLRNMRARRGEYDPERLAEIRRQGGSEVYANLTSVKCRAASSWIRDILSGTGAERPWTIRPRAEPMVSPDQGEAIVSRATQPIKNAIMAGAPLDQQTVREMLLMFRDQARAEIMEQARQSADRMANKMETQLVEGGFLDALDKFVDDIVTFPSAVLKGPVVRNRPSLQWVQTATGYQPQVKDQLTLEWSRVDPFMIYPSPAATTVDDGYMIERHHLTREDLNAMIGVEGYNDASIRTVLSEYGLGGLRDWLINDMAIADAQGKSTASLLQNTDGTIDALQYWGSVSGQHLIDWGMDAAEVPDATKEYYVEAWLIGSHVIRCVLNYDPLHRKPYYKASYEDIPGCWWGNAVADLVREPQIVMNAAARGIVNNMGIASGPQVTVNVDLLPPGEDITQIYPWKIWQVKSDPMGSGSAANPAINFYQPDSRVGELVAIFEKFSEMADDYSGVPRYLAGQAAGVAGRTASGLSMLMQNASKSLKQVVSNIDMNVMQPMLVRLYEHNMQYSDDADLKGDVHIIARGAAGLIAKDATALRRNEFLQATANPFDMQILGLPGRAELLRASVKELDMDVDKVVPSPEAVRAMQQLQTMVPPAQPSGAVPPAAPGAGASPQKALPSPGATLIGGAPVTNHFAPSPAPPQQVMAA